jgi:5'-nucleotidase
VRLLLTNDDGIDAPGLRSLVRALRGLGEIAVVAPDREQSAVGASISIHHPVRVRRVSARGLQAHAVLGTPGDAVIMALDHLYKDKPFDAVVSGINHGTNLGADVFLSGTVGGALHGHFRGIPSIAFSMPLRKRPRFSTGAYVARTLIPLVVASDLFRHVLLNVTVPSLAPQDIQGVEVTRLRRGTSTFEVTSGHDGRRDFFWIGVQRTKKWSKETEEGTDAWALRNKRVSITPLHMDSTAYGAVETLAELRETLRKALSDGQSAS